LRRTLRRRQRTAHAPKLDIHDTPLSKTGSAFRRARQLSI
jgi:hypothetical protein